MWVICRSAIALPPCFLLAIHVPRGRGDSRAISEPLRLGQLLRLAKKSKQTPVFARLTSSSSAIETLSSLANAPKIILQRSATCCGVPRAHSYCRNRVCSAGDNLTDKPTLDMGRMHSKSHKLCFVTYGTLH